MKLLVASSLLLTLIIHSRHCTVALSQPESRRALLAVDVQLCFMPQGGDLPVPGADEVVPVINNIRQRVSFDLVVLTKDAHPPRHVSFASAHATGCDCLARQQQQRSPDLNSNGKYSGLLSPATVTLHYNEQGQLCNHTAAYGGGRQQPAALSVVCPPTAPPGTYRSIQQQLWPDHCLAGTPGSQLHPGLETRSTDVVLEKGGQPHVDSYSAFFDNGYLAPTPLHGTLTGAGISEVYIAGIAQDFCVAFTARCAALLGYNVVVVRDATRAVSCAGGADAEAQMRHLGVKFVDSEELIRTLGVQAE